MGPGDVYISIETNGLDIRQIMMPFPYKDVSSGMMALIDKITSQCQGLGGAPDISDCRRVSRTVPESGRCWHAGRTSDERSMAAAPETRICAWLWLPSSS